GEVVLTLDDEYAAVHQGLGAFILLLISPGKIGGRSVPDELCSLGGAVAVRQLREPRVEAAAAVGGVGVDDVVLRNLFGLVWHGARGNRLRSGWRSGRRRRHDLQAGDGSLTASRDRLQRP